MPLGMSAGVSTRTWPTVILLISLGFVLGPVPPPSPPPPQAAAKSNVAGASLLITRKLLMGFRPEWRPELSALLPIPAEKGPGQRSVKGKFGTLRDWDTTTPSTPN